MSRHIVIPPENADRLDRDQLRRATKRCMRDVLGDRDGVDWAYTVHMDGGDRPHAHVVATGRAEQRGDPPLLNEDDLERLSIGPTNARENRNASAPVASIATANGNESASERKRGIVTAAAASGEASRRSTLSTARSAGERRLKSRAGDRDRGTEPLATPECGSLQATQQARNRPGRARPERSPLGDASASERREPPPGRARGTGSASRRPTRNARAVEDRPTDLRARRRGHDHRPSTAPERGPPPSG